MIPRTDPSWHRIISKEEGLLPSNHKIIAKDKISNSTTAGWQQELKEIVTHPSELLKQLELDPKQYLTAATEAAKLFEIKVPQSYIHRMKKGDINDPLLKQVLPVGAEFNKVPGYTADPVGEQDNSNSGLIQKYQGRALLMINGHCAINCRYCFRREFPYSDHRLNRKDWETTLEHIDNDSSINEVIFSGGDPLASNDKQLSWITEQVANIPHIQRLRIHSRLPVVIPSRITTESIEWMTNHRLNTVMVLHINHPNELNDATLLNNITRMKQAGIHVLNQAVLLKGVNDSVHTLSELSERLFKAGVMPYYLHLLDKVNGSAHFDIPLEQAKSLHEQLTHQLSGYLVPKLVREVSGHPSKLGI